MTKFRSQGLHIIRIKYWNASGSGFPPSLNPTLWNIGILHYKQDKLRKHLQHSVPVALKWPGYNLKLRPSSMTWKDVVPSSFEIPKRERKKTLSHCFKVGQCSALAVLKWLSFQPFETIKKGLWIPCEQFLWNRNWDMGWFWAGWQYWKKHLDRLWATFEVGFFMFLGTKKI